MSDINWEALGAPFPAGDIEWRVQQSGAKGGRPWAMVLAYVTARAIQQRFDGVCGPAGWKSRYQAGPDGGVVCELSVKVDGEWIGKEDGAQNTDIEGVKGGISGALKRAAVVWGVGRYLYKLEAGWANFSDKGANRAKIDGESHKWDPPSLPSWALPGRTTPKVSSPSKVGRDAKDHADEAKKKGNPARESQATDKPRQQHRDVNGMPASDAQIQFLKKLLKRHVVTEQEREKMLAVVDSGMSSKQATKSLNGLQAAIAERMEKEKEGVALLREWREDADVSEGFIERIELILADHGKAGMDVLLAELTVKHGAPSPF